MSAHLRPSRLAFLFLGGALLGSAHLVVNASSAECEVDLGGNLTHAYICSEQKLRAAKKQLDKQLAATAQAFPSDARNEGLTTVTKRDVRAAHAAWTKYVQLHCALAAELPGKPGDWHFQASNRNLCEIDEISKRLQVLEKWRMCAIEGGGVCLP